jgi:hypothetical protein
MTTRVDVLAQSFHICIRAAGRVCGNLTGPHAYGVGREHFTAADGAGVSLTTRRVVHLALRRRIAWGKGRIGQIVLVRADFPADVASERPQREAAVVFERMQELRGRRAASRAAKGAGWWSCW